MQNMNMKRTWRGYVARLCLKLMVNKLKEMKVLLLFTTHGYPRKWLKIFIENNFLKFVLYAIQCTNFIKEKDIVVQLKATRLFLHSHYAKWHVLSFCQIILWICKCVMIFNWKCTLLWPSSVQSNLLELIFKLEIEL
jgi:hypothetical protein